MFIFDQFLADEDIGCSIPSTPDAMFGKYNWFLSSIRIARLFSMTYTSLFSISAIAKPKGSYQAMIQDIGGKLEEWRLSVPIDFRSGEAVQMTLVSSPCERLVRVQTWYSYYALVIALERLALHIEPRGTNCRGEERLINAARAIVELVAFIDIEPHMPIL